MIQYDMFSLPNVREIYIQMTNRCYQFSSESYKTKKQVKSIIKGLIVEGLFRYYHVPNIVSLALNANIENRLLAYLNKLHQQNGEKLSGSCPILILNKLWNNGKNTVIFEADGSKRLPLKYYEPKDKI